MFFSATYSHIFFDAIILAKRTVAITRSVVYFSSLNWLYFKVNHGTIYNFFCTTLHQLRSHLLYISTNRSKKGGSTKSILLFSFFICLSKKRPFRQAFELTTENLGTYNGWPHRNLSFTYIDVVLFLHKKMAAQGGKKFFSFFLSLACMHALYKRLFRKTFVLHNSRETRNIMNVKHETFRLG